MASRTSLKSEFAFFQSSSEYYSYPLTLSNVGEPPEVEFHGTISKFKKKSKVRRCLFTFSIKREIRMVKTHLLTLQTEGGKGGGEVLVNKVLYEETPKLRPDVQTRTLLYPLSVPLSAYYFIVFIFSTKFEHD